MSCSPFDLRDYFLKELDAHQQSQMEVHVRSCAPCREEVERLRITENALFTLRDEEIPQRIAFVSDPVFDPPVWRRVWAAFWGSGGRLAFAGAAMLSGAIVFSAVHERPQPLLISGAAQPAPVVQTVSEADIQARVDVAVARAVTASEQQQVAKTHQLMAQLEETRKRLVWAADEYAMQEKRARAVALTAGLYDGPRERGGIQ